jgi:TPR repeat protein
MNNPLKYFAELTDPRVERNREHLLDEILLIAIAAEQGHTYAQFMLTRMRDENENNGQGVPQDDALAAEWYRKAADQGVVETKATLAALRKTEPAPTDQPEPDGQIKESVDASSLAEALLQYAFAPASQELLQDPASRHQ